MSTTLQILEEHAQYARNQRCTCGWRPDYALDHLQHPAGIQHMRHLAEVLDAAQERATPPEDITDALDSDRQQFRRARVREEVAAADKVEQLVPAVIMVRPGCIDPEAYAAAHNAGYETAVAQGLADDPSLADDWLQDRLREAAAAGLRSVGDIWGSVGRATVRMSELREADATILSGDWDKHITWNLADIRKEQARAAAGPQ